MRDYRLDQQELAELRAAHRPVRNAREAYRLNAVILLASGMSALLHRLGYVDKKPKRVPGKGDPDKQQAFLAEQEQRKAAEAVAPPTYYVDAVHPQHNPVLGDGWIKRGKVFKMPSNTGRRRLNSNGAISVSTLRGEFRFDATIDYADQLRMLLTENFAIVVE